MPDDLICLREEKELLREKLNDIRKQETELRREEKLTIEKIAKISSQIMRIKTN